jgi:molecular chaperone HscB
MTCWSCQKPLDGQILCAACGAIQPLPAGTDHFAIFGLPRRFEVALPDLEKRFRELSFQVHPDRFARKAPKERRIALERSTALNDAYRTLKDPLRRATYLLKLNGLKVESESGGSAMGALPPEFLEEIMELREGLMEAQAAGNSEAARKLLDQVQDRRGQAIATVDAELRTLPEPPLAPDPARLATAGAALAKIRYYDRFVAEAEGRHED